MPGRTPSGVESQTERTQLEKGLVLYPIGLVIPQLPAGGGDTQLHWTEEIANITPTRDRSDDLETHAPHHVIEEAAAFFSPDELRMRHRKGRVDNESPLGALENADVVGVFAVEDDLDSLVDSLGCGTCPTFVLSVSRPVSGALFCLACESAGSPKHNRGQAEHADTTAWPILSSSSLPISSISFDPNEAKRLEGWS